MWKHKKLFFYYYHYFYFIFVNFLIPNVYRPLGYLAGIMVWMPHQYFHFYTLDHQTFLWDTWLITILLTFLNLFPTWWPQPKHSMAYIYRTQSSLTSWTWRVYYNKQAMLTIRKHLITLPFFFDWWSWERGRGVLSVYKNISGLSMFIRIYYFELTI